MALEGEGQAGEIQRHKEAQLEAVQDAISDFIKIIKENELYDGSSNLGDFTDCRGTLHDTWFTLYYDDGTYEGIPGDGYPIDEDTDFTYLYGAANYLQARELVEGPAVQDCRDARQAVLDTVEDYTGQTHLELLCIHSSTATPGDAKFKTIQDAVLAFIKVNLAGNTFYKDRNPWDDLTDFEHPNPLTLPWFASTYSLFYGDYSDEFGYPIEESTDLTYLYGATVYVAEQDPFDYFEAWETQPSKGFTLASDEQKAVLSAIEDYTGLSAGQLLAGVDWQVFAEAEAASAPGGTAASVASANLVTCDEPEVIEEEPPCPPPCVGDPNAITPNWTKLTENEPFLNAKTCEYSITLNTKYEATSIENLYNDPDYLTEGVIKLLEFYGKKTEPYSQTLEDGSEGAEVDPVQLCVDAGTIKETCVSTRSFVKMKALIVVPWTTFNSIEELGPPEEMPDKEDYPAYVKIRGADFLLMTKQVARSMEILAVRQAIWFFNEGGRISEPTLNLKDEAERIRVFRKDFRALLRENDFKFKRSFGGKKRIDEIEIGFDSDMRVDYITATEIGCDKPEKMTKTMGAFKNSDPQTIQRTMYFVSKLPEIWNDVTATEPLEFGDFLTKYVAFPPVEILVDVYGEDALFCRQDLSVEDDPTFMGNLGDEFAELGKDIMDEIVSLQDAFADKFANDLCATLEGKRKNDVKLDNLGELAERARDTALKEFFAGDRNLEQLPELLKEIATDPDELWTKILDKLGVCGLLALMESAFACLFAGLSFDDAMKEMVKAAFNAMDEANFQRIFIGLPPDVQREVFDNLEKDVSNIPPPWDAGYRAGSYSGQGRTMSVDKENLPETAQEWQSSDEVVGPGVPTFEGSTTGVAIDEHAINRAYGNPGSIGTAADSIMDSVSTAYKQALINMIDNNVIDLDMLMAQLNELPGAPIVARILQQMDCPPFPLFTPPIGDFFKTLELDFCRGHFAISLPVLNEDFFSMDIFRIIINIAKELIEYIVIKLIILILKKLLEIIFDALCALLGVIGGALLNLITGGNDFRNALGDALCPDATDDQIDEALRTMMEATGVGSCTTPGQVPTPEDAAAFSEVLAAVLTNGEVIDLLNGEATSQVKQMISDVTADQIPSLACMQPSDIENLFKALGTIVNPDLLDQAQKIDSLDTPVCNSICASPSQLAMFNDIRCSMMQSKGLTPEECEEQIEAMTDRAKKDLADLANVLQGGPFQEFPPILGSDPICPDSGDPFAPGGSILPEIPEAMNEIAKQAAKNTFESIDKAHIRDLVGRRGFFDMVLSDSNGLGIKVHERKVRRRGSQLASELGMGGSYTDNWADDQAWDTAIPKGEWGEISGREDAVGTGENTDIELVAYKSGFAEGGYPMTVAILLQKYFTQYNETVIGFEDSLKIAEGFEPRPMRPVPPVAPCKGSKWESDGSYTLVTGFDFTNLMPITETVEYKGFDLEYQDYSEKPMDQYHFKLTAATALKEGGVWNDVDKTETILWEKTGMPAFNLDGSVDGEAEGELSADWTQVQRFRITHDTPDDVEALLETLNLDLVNNPLDEEAFSSYITSVIESYPGYDAAAVAEVKTNLRNALPFLQDVYMRKFALLLASNGEGYAAGDDQPPPDPFQFGYDESQTQIQAYMAGPNVDKEFAKANGRKLPPEPDESFDQQIYNRFNGNADNPPFYLRDPDRWGWLGMMDKFVPEVDACDPIDGTAPREPICKFEDLKDVYMELMNKYQDDKRLFAKPGSDCAQDIPFNIALTRGAQAGIDTSIMAIARIYAIEVLLRGGPVCAVFGSKCFGEIISNYVVKSIDEDVQQMGVFGPSKKYYYRFMEQIVQMYGRQVDLGMIEPTPSEQEAMDYLNELQLTFVPPKGLFNKSKYNKERDEMVQIALDHEKATYEPGILTLLSRIVLIELESMSKQFEENLHPEGMPVPNLQSLFLGSASFIQGSLEAGVLDVWNGVDPVADPEKTEPLAKGYAETDEGEIVPFRLERYLRVTPLSNTLTPSPMFPARPKDVENLDSFIDWANNQPDKADMLLSELFENVSLGYRLVFTTALDTDDEEWGSYPATRLPGNLALAVTGMPIIEEKSFVVPCDGGTLYMVPLASHEMDVDPNSDQTLQQFLDDIEGFDETNRSCILDELANTDAYKLLFGICVPLEKMVSWLAVYSINNFLPSIGWVEDGWTVNGGKWYSFAKGFRTWDQKTFEKSKKAAKRVFMQFYNSNDPTYESDEQKADKKKLTKGERPKSQRNNFLRWFAWRRKYPKPTDKNEVLCP